MMEDYINKITCVEENLNWLEAINLLKKTEESNINITVRGIFVLAYFLTEGQYNSEEYIFITENLTDFYNKSKIKFHDNSQFLFFTGITIYLGEWYFNVDIDIAEQMLKKAKDNEPNNLLYEWGYSLYINQNSSVNTQLKLKLCEQVLFKSQASLSVLKEFGLIGRYIKGILDSTYDNLLRHK